MLHEHFLNTVSNRELLSLNLPVLHVRESKREKGLYAMHKQRHVRAAHDFERSDRAFYSFHRDIMHTVECTGEHWTDLNRICFKI